MGADLFPALIKVMTASLLLLFALAIFARAESNPDARVPAGRTVMELRGDEERMLRAIRQRLSEKSGTRRAMARSRVDDERHQRKMDRQVKKVFNELEQSVADLR